MNQEEKPAPSSDKAVVNQMEIKAVCQVVNQDHIVEPIDDPGRKPNQVEN